MDIPNHLIADTQNFDAKTSVKSKSPIVFDKAFINKITSNPNRCGFFTCEGEAMKPTIEGECLLLIDFADNKLRDGKVYLLSIGNRMLVRRVQILLDKIILVADNPQYPNIEIFGEDLNRLKVEGQVRFMGKIFS